MTYHEQCKLDQLKRIADALERLADKFAPEESPVLLTGIRCRYLDGDCVHPDKDCKDCECNSDVDGSAGQLPNPKIGSIVFVAMNDTLVGAKLAVPAKVMGLLTGMVRLAIPQLCENDEKPVGITYGCVSRSAIFPTMAACLKHQFNTSVSYSEEHALDFIDALAFVHPEDAREADDTLDAMNQQN